MWDLPEPRKEANPRMLGQTVRQHRRRGRGSGVSSLPGVSLGLGRPAPRPRPPPAAAAAAIAMRERAAAGPGAGSGAVRLPPGKGAGLGAGWVRAARCALPFLPIPSHCICSPPSSCRPPAQVQKAAFFGKFSAESSGGFSFLVLFFFLLFFLCVCYYFSPSGTGRSFVRSAVRDRAEPLRSGRAHAATV